MPVHPCCQSVKQEVVSYHSPKVLDHFMVQQPIGGNETSPDRHLIGKTDRFSVEVRHLSSRFGTNQHPCGCISDSECPPEINKTIYPSAAYITELESRCTQKAPASDLLTKLHHTCEIEFSPVDTHCTFIKLGNFRYFDGIAIASRVFPFFSGKGFSARKIANKCLLCHTLFCVRD